MKRGRWSCEASTEGSHANRGTLPYYTHVANLRTLICADFRPSLSSKRLGALTVRPHPLRAGRTQERSAPTYPATVRRVKHLAQRQAFTLSDNHSQLSSALGWARLMSEAAPSSTPSASGRA